MNNSLIKLAPWVIAVAGLAGCYGLPLPGMPMPPQAPQAQPLPPPPPQVAAQAAPPVGALPVSLVQDDVPDVDLIRVSHAMTDALVAELKKNYPNFRKHKPVLVTSFVTQSAVDNSSELGLLLADQVSTRLTQQGYSVLEAKLRQALSIKENQGEFVLSRNIEKLSKEYKAYAVVVGNYTRSRDIIYLTSRMIQVKNKQILAAVSAKMPIGPKTRELMIEKGHDMPLTVVNR